MKKQLSARLAAIYGGALIAGTFATSAFADGVDYTAAALSFKTDGLAALATWAPMVVAVIVAFALFRRVKGVIK